MHHLIVALAAFVGTHFLMSHPLRAPMVARLGNNGQQIAYSLVSFVTFGWAVWVYRALPPQSPLWSPLGPESLLVSGIMLIAALLLAGSFIRNPALAAPGADAAAAADPKGVLAITRHPMMWSFTLWSIAHVLANPTPKLLALCAAIAIMALGGSAGQDVKKARVMGPAWQGWVAKTSYWPFAAQISGRLGWASIWPGAGVIIVGIAIWVAAAWLHPVGVGVFAN
jgi:uncharacterized membrane protein